MADTVRDLEKALEECRAVLVVQLEADLAFCCPHLPDGSLDESEMDEAAISMIEESRRLLGTVDAALSAHKAAPDGWRPMPAREQPGVFPFTGERLLLCWEAFSSIPAHVELGRWRSGTGAGSGWCNTYRHSFASTPTLFMPLPSPPDCATKEKGNG